MGRGYRQQTNKVHKMKDNPKKIIWIVLAALLGLAAISALIQSVFGNNLQRDAAKTRQSLRDQGFKTDLTDFDFTTDPAARSRESALTFSSSTVHQSTLRK